MPSSRFAARFPSLPHTRLAPLGPALIAACLAAGLAGCTGGLSIHNTSDHDITFSHRVDGGEVSHTLNPGATLDLPAGSRVRMPDYVIEDR